MQVKLIVDKDFNVIKVEPTNEYDQSGVILNLSYDGFNNFLNDWHISIFPKKFEEKEQQG